MVQKVVVLDLCSICYKDREDEVASAHSQVIGVGQKILQLDWCEKCDEQLRALSDFIGLFVHYGQRLDDVRGKSLIAPTPTQYVCEICVRKGKAKTFAKEANFNTHMEAHQNPDAYKCPECEGQEVTRSNGTPVAFGGAQALATHRNRSHGVLGTKHQGKEPPKAKKAPAKKAAGRKLRVASA